MTAPARITQADIERATKAVRAAGFEHARIVMRLDKSEIEIIIGETTPDSPGENPWDDE